MKAQTEQLRGLCEQLAASTREEPAALTFCRMEAGVHSSALMCA